MANSNGTMNAATASSATELGRSVDTDDGSRRANSNMVSAHRKQDAAKDRTQQAKAWAVQEDQLKPMGHTVLAE